MSKRSSPAGMFVVHAIVPFLMVTTDAVMARQEQKTIPEYVAAGTYNRIRSAPSGKSPTLENLMANADLVVRGIVGESQSYLSPDKQDVFTDYLLVSPLVLYERTAQTTRKPGPLNVTVTQLGGTVMVGNTEFTQTERGLPPLIPGTDAIFILRVRDGKYHIARTFYGVFAVLNDRVRPLTSKQDFAREYREAPVATLLTDLMSLLPSTK